MKNVSLKIVLMFFNVKLIDVVVRWRLIYIYRNNYVVADHLLLLTTYLGFLYRLNNVKYSVYLIFPSYMNITKIALSEVIHLFMCPIKKGVHLYVSRIYCFIYIMMKMLMYAYTTLTVNKAWEIHQDI